jgi:hypothetical protein
MSVTSTFRAFARLKEQISCSGIVQTWVGGENVETYENKGTRYVTVLPLNAEFLKYDKEGVYTHKDVKIWEDSTYEALMPLRAVVIRKDNSIYRINEMNDRTNEGNFRTYIAKKIESTP